MTAPILDEPIRLTQFSHGGGCGCKIAPAVLREILSDTPFASHLAEAYPDLMVGIEHGDDAAVYRLNDEQAIVATTDFFMPIVDDPFEFGRIAATNALSDVYAMGGRPLFALAIVGMPIGKLPNDVIRKILAGGESVCRQAGIPIAGGHSIDAPEPIYGLVGIGVVNPRKVKQNAGGQAGDRLILGKPLGVGIYSAALKKGALSADQYAAMIAATTQLNTAGADLAEMEDVHGMTDITGFGLLGHLLEISRASNLAARVEMSRLPLLPGVGGAVANFVSYVVAKENSKNRDNFGPSRCTSSTMYRLRSRAWAGWRRTATPPAPASAIGRAMALKSAWQTASPTGSRRC